MAIPTAVCVPHRALHHIDWSRHGVPTNPDTRNHDLTVTLPNPDI